jgi:hypothetical protein
MTGESKSPLPGFGWAEQAEARNPEQVCRGKHAGIDAEKQIAFPQQRKCKLERQAWRVNDPVSELSGDQPRLLEIEDEDRKVRMALEKRDGKFAQTISWPCFFSLGFLMDSQDALARRGRFQELTDSQVGAGRQRRRQRKVIEPQRGVQVSRNGESRISRVLLGGRGQSNLEGRREAHGWRGREKRHEAVERCQPPGIERKKKVAFADLPGYSSGVEKLLPSAPAHFDFTHQAQSKIGEECLSKTRHTYQRKTGGNKAGQGSQGREGEEVVARGVTRDYRRISETRVERLKSE